MDLQYSLLGLAFLWLGILSFFLLRSILHYRKLTTRTGSKGIDDVLDALLAQSAGQDRDMTLIKQAIVEIEAQAQKYIQRVGYVKFSPFERVGGEQSFVIALLDKNGTGIVKTFLYTREGVRIYVKQVRDGKATEYELSDEEKQAISSAQ